MTRAENATRGQTAVTFIRSTAGWCTADMALAWTSRTARIDTSDLQDQFADRPDPVRTQAVIACALETPGVMARDDRRVNGHLELLGARYTATPSQTVEVVWCPRLERPPELRDADETRAIVRWRADGAEPRLGSELAVPRLTACETVEAFRDGQARLQSPTRRPVRVVIREGEVTIAWGKATGVGVVDEVLGLGGEPTRWERLARAAHNAQLTASDDQWTLRRLARTAGISRWRAVAGRRAVDALFPGLLVR